MLFFECAAVQAAILNGDKSEAVQDLFDVMPVYQGAGGVAGDYPAGYRLPIEQLD